MKTSYFAPQRALRTFTIVFVVAGGHHAFAQTAPVNPIKLDKLLTGVGAIRLDASVAYSNGSFALNPFGTGPGQMPPALANASINTDSFASNLALSYGLSKSLQLSASTAYINETSSSPTFPELGKDRNSSLGGLNLSLSYQLLHDAASKVSVVAFAGLDVAREVRVAEIPNSSKRVSGKSGSVGMTINKVVDPIVFSLSAAFQKNISDTLAGSRVELPNAFTISPSISFQVNERVGLGWGAHVSRFGDYRVGGSVISAGQTTTSFDFMTTYQLSKDSGLAATFNFPTGRSGPSTLAVRWIEDF